MEEDGGEFTKKVKRIHAMLSSAISALPCEVPEARLLLDKPLAVTSLFAAAFSSIQELGQSLSVCKLCQCPARSLHLQTCQQP